MLIMSFGGGDRTSSSTSNLVSLGDGSDRKEGRLIHVDATGLAPTEFVLGPSPSLDPVFTDLLDINRRSSVLAISDYTPTQTENNPSFEELIRKIDYLNELMRDENMLQQVPGFHHLQKLLTREITRIRTELHLRRPPMVHDDKVIQPERQPRVMSDDRFNLGSTSDGRVVTVVDKVYPPVEQYPQYNFIGRLIGPRGQTVKQLEQESGCQITIRGRGSENKGRHFKKRGQLGYENETEPLHIRIEALDYKERAQMMVYHAKELIQKLLIPVNNDKLRQMQFYEMSMMQHRRRIQQLPSAQGQNSFVPAPYYMQPPAFQFIPPPVVYIDAPSVVYLDGNSFLPMM